MYEIVLRRTGHDDEVRLTDENAAQVGDVLRIERREWTVVEVGPGEARDAALRIVCVPRPVR